MLVDLRTHNCVGSADASVSPIELVKKGKKRGIDVIAVTDHDSYEGVEYVKKACEDEGAISFICGVELSTKLGGFLILGADKDDVLGSMKDRGLGNARSKGAGTPTILEIDQVIAEIQSKGGVVIYAHPFGTCGGDVTTMRFYLDLFCKTFSASNTPVAGIQIAELLDFVRKQNPALFAVLQRVDAIEVLNPLCWGVKNCAAFALADYLDKSQTGGSDCHTIDQVGVCATEVPAQTSSEIDLLVHIKQKTTTPKLDFRREGKRAGISWISTYRVN
jgi:predicted metal-dependent phosphoesterase TrpH